MKARILTISLIIGFAFLFQGCDGSDSTSGEEIIPLEAFSPSTIDTENWMSKIQDRPLNQIVIPGSHDSGMSHVSNCIPMIEKTVSMSRTQKSIVGVQLHNGSRYFDIRLSYYPGRELITYHRTDGLGCDGEFFRSIMQSTADFLINHPHEFVILKFSHFRNDGGCSAAQAQAELVLQMKAWDAYCIKKTGRELFYKSDHNIFFNLFNSLWLRDVRGQVLAVLDSSCAPILNPSEGRFWYWDVGNGGAWLYTNFPVYDEYSNSANYWIMEADQLKKWNKYGGFFKSHLFLLSWILTPTTLSGGVESLAKKANSHLPGVMLNDIWKSAGIKFFPNIVFIDFVDKEINQYIIQYNPDIRRP